MPRSTGPAGTHRANGHSIPTASSAISSHKARHCSTCKAKIPPLKESMIAMPWKDPQAPMARSRSAGRQITRIKAGASTVHSRNPMPSTMRVPSNNPGFGDTAPPAEPSASKINPSISNRRKPKRSPPQATSKPPSMLATWITPKRSPENTNPKPSSASNRCSANGSFQMFIAATTPTPTTIIQRPAATPGPRP
ncbi:hypothetical protein GCM10017709_33100 [Glutamicibacter nicotianae]|uniref:Uncharacterized protein n=1 Tax=Glutamicibacter nicotianae TaxID=37929 RepID=A0ABQ0RPE3_GLUNI|nr:hypothetical protein ANI01nite_28910 [Glutamicibacter nicotianae]